MFGYTIRDRQTDITAKMKCLYIKQHCDCYQELTIYAEIYGLQKNTERKTAKINEPDIYTRQQFLLPTKKVYCLEIQLENISTNFEILEMKLLKLHLRNGENFENSKVWETIYFYPILTIKSGKVKKLQLLKNVRNVIRI